MTQRTVIARINDMLETIDNIRKIEVVAIETPSWVVKLATERAFAILSEASRHIPDDLKMSEVEVPWRDIAGIGSVIRHDYQSVSGDVLSNATVCHLSPLEDALLRIKAKLLAA